MNYPLFGEAPEESAEQVCLAAENLVDSADQARALAQILKGVAHGTRLRLIAALCIRPHTVTELCTRVELKQNLVSQHLGVLRMLGLVAARRKGGNSTYEIVETRLGNLVQCLLGCRR